MINYLKKIFGNNIKMYNIKKIKMDDVAKYSVTHYEHSVKIAKIIIDKMGTYNLKITDACACVGSDTMTFANTFKKVNAIELDKVRYSYLIHNLLVANIYDVNVINNDCLVQIPKLKQDVIYADAPWGGPDYKYKKNINLYLSNKSITSLIPFFLKHCKLLVLKVPKNFVFEELKKYKKYKYNIFNLNKFFIITIY